MRRRFAAANSNTWQVQQHHTPGEPSGVFSFLQVFVVKVWQTGRWPISQARAALPRPPKGLPCAPARPQHHHVVLRRAKLPLTASEQACKGATQTQAYPFSTLSSAYVVHQPASSSFAQPSSMVAPGEELSAGPANISLAAFLLCLSLPHPQPPPHPLSVRAAGRLPHDLQGAPSASGEVCVFSAVLVWWDRQPVSLITIDLQTKMIMIIRRSRNSPEGKKRTWHASRPW